MIQDFWEAHRWPAGERHVHWHILFDDQPAVRDFVRAHAEVLGRYPQLNPVPLEWLHATLLLVGPLTPAQADELAATARPAVRGIEPFELEVGPTQALPNGVTQRSTPNTRSPSSSEFCAASPRASSVRTGCRLRPSGSGHA